MKCLVVSVGGLAVGTLRWVGLVPGSASEGSKTRFIRRALIMNSAVMDLGSGSLWVDLDPGSKGAIQAFDTIRVGPVTWSWGPVWYWDNPGELVS